eukprot:TRINITY_DN8349_c0_g4_i2.p1 TRINITY_DN8349_c0_g4~~TRINITY_DN8349_c0_g4_i2.p1  ORF type:complete len:504 (+),score=101.32 TRINITY_DN8349_c0_g4_i2:73-1584(+)
MRCRRRWPLPSDAHRARGSAAPAAGSHPAPPTVDFAPPGRTAVAPPRDRPEARWETEARMVRSGWTRIGKAFNPTAQPPPPELADWQDGDCAKHLAQWCAEKEASLPHSRQPDSPAVRNLVAKLEAEWQRLSAGGAELGSRSYCTAIALCARLRKVRSAEEWHRRMMALPSVVDPLWAHNAMLGAYAKVGDAPAARRLWRTLREQHLEPNEGTYSAMIRCFGNAGDHAAARAAFHALAQRGSPSPLAWAAAISASETVEEAWQIYRRAQAAAEGAVNVAVAEVLLARASLDGDVGAAERAMAECDAAAPASPQRWALLAATYDAAAQPGGTLEVCRRCRAAGTELTLLLARRAVHAAVALLRSGRPDAAEREATLSFVDELCSQHTELRPLVEWMYAAAQAGQGRGQRPRAQWGAAEHRELRKERRQCPPGLGPGAWQCGCGFWNRLEHAACGGRGELGCKLPRPPEQPRVSTPAAAAPPAAKHRSGAGDMPAHLRKSVPFLT